MSNKKHTLSTSAFTVKVGDGPADRNHESERGGRGST
jgi:hypothetical protein